MYYEPNIAATRAPVDPIVRAALVGSLLSLLLWSVIIAIALTLILR
jgi:hypothetical protein